MSVHHRLVSTFSAFAWNADRSMLAVCPNSPEVWIFTNCHDPDLNNWVKQYTLKQHDLLVSGIDWHPEHHMIVTCSHDRNAFVWSLDPATDTWVPTVAMLRINRAAMDVKWSPDGLKFAVATGGKSVCVCTYEERNNWWMTSHVKGHNSTVLSVSWHPNSQLIATGCCDFKARVMSATTKEDRPHAGPFPAALPQGKPYAEHASNAWVEDAVWSPSGQQLAYTSHDSVITFVNYAAGGAVTVLPHRELPYTRLLFLSECCLVAVGHSRNPTLYTADATTGEWSLYGQLDKGDRTTSKSLSSFGTARDMFVSKTRTGEAASATAEGVPTVHQGSITLVAACSPSYPITCFSTAGVDGILAIWNLPELDVDLAAVGLV